MIASNLPDIDVAVFATSIPSVAFRRGWTHGVLAQAILPVMLAAAVWAYLGRRPRDAGPPLRFLPLLAASYVGVVTHVLMDLLNNYGVRLLMPFDGRWFYGDVLFIIDPWLWLSLGLGVWLAHRRQSVVPARTGLAVAVVYVLAMTVGARTARAAIVERWEAVDGQPPRAVMVGPVPITPLSRAIILDAGDHYETGQFTWQPRAVRFDVGGTPRNDTDPAVTRARTDPDIQAFLVWSRFPYWTVETTPRGTVVTVGDMRFVGQMPRGVRFTRQVLVTADGRVTALP
jgi:inner membrane protein